MINKVIVVLMGFFFGVSLIVFFVCVGGGIYIKVVDVGADFVGKVEVGILEDYLFNFVIIVDNVGDNVGDVVGMGVDFFESYVGFMIGVMVLGVVLMVLLEFEGLKIGFGVIGVVLLFLCFVVIGIVVSMIGMMFVLVEEGGDFKVGFICGELIVVVIMFVGGYFIIISLLFVEWVLGGTKYIFMGVFYVSLIGFVCGLGIGFVIEYYIGFNKESVMEIFK